MKILISPSKTLNFDDYNTYGKPTDCRLLSHTSELHKILTKYSINEIKNLMKVSDKIAELNFNRFKTWENPSESSVSKQAIYAFKGDVYSGLDVDTIQEDKFEYMQNNLRIISGFYGLLRPFDKILPYRLEMGTKLKNSKGKNLYEFWGEKITGLLSEDILNKDDHVINLASNEYFKSIKVNSIESNVITPTFKEFKNGTYKTIAIYAKKARGMMSRYIIENELEDIEDIKTFNNENYTFDDSLSNSSNFTFVR